MAERASRELVGFLGLAAALNEAHTSGILGDLVHRELIEPSDVRASRTIVGVAMAQTAAILASPLGEDSGGCSLPELDHEQRHSVPWMLLDRAKAERWRVHVETRARPQSPPASHAPPELVGRILTRIDVEDENPLALEKVIEEQVANFRRSPR